MAEPAMIGTQNSVVVDHLRDENERLRREVKAFREAIRSGDGPSCEDVCLVECIGVCGADSGGTDG